MKVKMDDIFKRKKILKSGEVGKTYEFPTTLTMYTSEEHIKKWIEYSALDSESTFFLRQTLESNICLIQRLCDARSQLPTRESTIFGQSMKDTGGRLDSY